MTSGQWWFAFLCFIGIIVSLIILIVDKSEIRTEKAVAVFHISIIPICVMVCQKRGGPTFIDLVFLTYFVIKLKNSLMAIWEYYDPSPW